MALAEEDGSLHLEFTEGAAIDVAPGEDDVESWWFDMEDEMPGP